MQICYNNAVSLGLYNISNMPRQARKTSGTGIYHVMLRGINRQDLFEDDEDVQKFLQCLSNNVDPFDEHGYRLPSFCTIFAYCLMPNHVHLLLQEKHETLGEVVKRITIAYAYYFNRKYQRNGHLFQDRFRSEPVNDIKYFKTLLRYIHQNPVLAGIAENVGDYLWRSWHEYEKKNTGLATICNTSSVLHRISWQELSDYVCEPVTDNGGILEMDDEPPRSIPDSAIKEFLSIRFGIENVMEIQNLDKDQRNIIIREACKQGAGFRQLARITGISFGIIRKRL